MIKRIFIVALAVLLVLPVAGVSAQAYPFPEADLVGPDGAIASWAEKVPDAHSITSSWAYVGGNTVITYVVEQDGGLNGISHFVVPDGCPIARISVEGCQNLAYGTDPTTQVTGIKCDEAGPRTIVVTYAGRLTITTGTGAIKYGNANAYFDDLYTVSCVPQAVTIEVFEIRGGAFYWVSGSPEGLDYQVKLATPAGSRTEVWMTPVIPAQYPGGLGSVYWAKPTRPLVPGMYQLWAHDNMGRYGVAATFAYDAGRVR